MIYTLYCIEQLRAIVEEAPIAQPLLDFVEENSLEDNLCTVFVNSCEPRKCYNIGLVLHNTSMQQRANLVYSPPLTVTEGCSLDVQLHAVGEFATTDLLSALGRQDLNFRMKVPSREIELDYLFAFARTNPHSLSANIINDLSTLVSIDGCTAEVYNGYIALCLNTNYPVAHHLSVRAATQNYKYASRVLTFGEVWFRYRESLQYSDILK